MATIWQRSHYLNKMTLRELVVAFGRYYAIQAYVALALISGTVAALTITSPPRAAVAATLAVLLYPATWYALHRWVLHSRWMFKNRWTARTWKRIHYDHHQDPHHLEVLFGALYTTLPTIALVTLPLGWAFDGLGGAMAALCTGLVTTCFYEFSHCIQHLSYKPKNKFLATIKARHMAHHFHDETGNFGITDFSLDRLLGTFYERHQRPAKSPTVFNLGYTQEMAVRYPWVAALSGGVQEDATPRDRRVQEESANTDTPSANAA